MEICVNLGSLPALKQSKVFASFARPILEGLVIINQMYLRTHNIPPLYQSGVRYQEEPPNTTEEFASIPVVLKRGWGDCDDLAPWRVAELRNGGERARIRISWRRNRRGRKIFHVLVRRGDGTIEDPSRRLGMRG